MAMSDRSSTEAVFDNASEPIPIMVYPIKFLWITNKSRLMLTIAIIKSHSYETRTYYQIKL